MKKNFLFESDFFMTSDQLYCAQIRVEIKIEIDQCITPKGTQNVWNWEFVSFYDEDNRIHRNFSDFPEKEQEKILKLAESLADTYNYEARVSGF